jgi:MFS family permease
MVLIRDQFRRTQTAIAALFFLLGFQYATWAARLPTIAARLHIGTAEIGVLLLACGVGAAASFPLVAYLMRKLGSRRVAHLASLFLILCLLSLVVTPSYPVTVVVLCLDGVGVACLDVAMNAQGAALEARHDRATMARLHATFSAGALFAALLASGIGKLTPTLWVHFAVAAVILLALVEYARPRLSTEDTQAPRKERDRLALPSRLTALLGVAMALATIAEGAMNDWSALYLKQVGHASSALAPMGIAVFSATMVLARVFADRWRTRWGDRRVVLVGATLAGLGLGIGLLAGGVLPALAGFACVGLGIAAVAPCIYVVAAGQGSDALTLVAAMGVTGMLAGPPVIGAIANGGGLVWGLGAVAVAAVLVALSATRIPWPATADSEIPN